MNLCRAFQAATQITATRVTQSGSAALLDHAQPQSFTPSDSNPPRTRVLPKLDAIFRIPIVNEDVDVLFVQTAAIKGNQEFGAS